MAGEDYPIGVPQTNRSAAGAMRPTPSMLAIRERAVGAVLHCGWGGGARRYGVALCTASTKQYAV